MTLPSASPRDTHTIAFIREDEVTLGAYELLNYTGDAYKFNTYPLRRYGSNFQEAKGDHTLILENLTFRIRGLGNPQAVQRQLYRQLRFTKYVDVDGFRLEIAAALGIRSLDFLTPTEFIADIEIIPATAYWSDGVNDVIAVT